MLGRRLGLVVRRLNGGDGENDVCVRRREDPLVRSGWLVVRQLPHRSMVDLLVEETGLIVVVEVLLLLLVEVAGFAGFDVVTFSVGALVFCVVIGFSAFPMAVPKAVPNKLVTALESPLAAISVGSLGAAAWASSFGFSSLDSIVGLFANSGFNSLVTGSLGLLSLDSESTFFSTFCSLGPVSSSFFAPTSGLLTLASVVVVGVSCSDFTGLLSV